MKILFDIHNIFVFLLKYETSLHVNSKRILLRKEKWISRDIQMARSHSIRILILRTRTRDRSAIVSRLLCGRAQQVGLIVSFRNRIE